MGKIVKCIEKTLIGVKELWPLHVQTVSEKTKLENENSKFFLHLNKIMIKRVIRLWA